MSHFDNDGGALRASTIDGDMLSCWLCSRPVAPVALFCHHCGAIQAPREIDHFARFGLERRFDLDLEHLHRCYERLHRTLDPMRFVAKGIGERSHAQRHSEALTRAFETLKDPIRRARYLLALVAESDQDDAAGAEPTPDSSSALAVGSVELNEPVDLVALRLAISRAADPGAIDRVANQATGEIETTIRELSAAFRSGQIAVAAAALDRLEGLEQIAAEARTLRAGL